MDKQEKKLKEIEVKEKLVKSATYVAIIPFFLGIICIGFSFVLDSFYLFPLGVISIIVSIIFGKWFYNMLLKNARIQYKGILDI